MNNLDFNLYGDTFNKTWEEINNSSTVVLREEKKRIEDELDSYDQNLPLSQWVLDSIKREQENEEKGKVSPTFSSVAEMKKWHEEN